MAYKKVYRRVYSYVSGWCEISYFNLFSGRNTLRNLLLGWIFAIKRGELGFAFELISQAKQLSDDPIIQKIENYTKSKFFGLTALF